MSEERKAMDCEPEAGWGGVTTRQEDSQRRK